MRTLYRPVYDPEGFEYISFDRECVAGSWTVLFALTTNRLTTLRRLGGAGLLWLGRGPWLHFDFPL